MILKLGVHPLGHENVQLYAVTDSSDGLFKCLSEDGAVARITVGLNYADWDQVVGLLFHEAFEMACARMGVRFTHANRLSQDHASYLFVFDHSQMCEICDAAAMFVIQALPDLEKAWKKARRGK